MLPMLVGDMADVGLCIGAALRGDVKAGAVGDGAVLVLSDRLLNRASGS